MRSHVILFFFAIMIFLKILWNLQITSEFSFYHCMVHDRGSQLSPVSNCLLQWYMYANNWVGLYNYILPVIGLISTGVTITVYQLPGIIGGVS